MTTVNKQQIIGKVIELVNNEDPNYTTNLLFVTSCKITNSGRFFCLGGIVFGISKENLSTIDGCYFNFFQAITVEGLEKLNQNSRNIS